MVELVKQTHYVMRSPNGPMLFVENKELAELLLSKASVRFKQDIKLEIYERKETDHRKTYNWSWRETIEIEQWPKGAMVRRFGTVERYI